MSYTTQRILVGDCMARLRDLPDGSVQTCVTSPPYFGLRDYGIEPSVWDGDPECTHTWQTESVDTEVGKGNWAQGVNGRGEGQPGGVAAKREPIRSVANRSTCQKCGAWRGALGMEPTVQMYVDHIVQVFREVRRVLRNDGTLWINLGDSYSAQATGPNAGGFNGEASKGRTRQATLGNGLKPKDLIGIPWRVAFALQADGWTLRSDVIWHKPNPMPESVTDRPTKSHEYIFLLTKQAKYFYDADAVREPHAQTETALAARNAINREGYKPKHQGWVNGGGMITRHRDYNPAGRNLRSVWTIATAPFPAAHFATYPPALVEPCIKAGTSEQGQCPACSTPWRRITEKSVAYGSGSGKAGNVPNGKYAGTEQAESGDYDIRMGPQISVVTTGWEPSCVCNLPSDPVPQVVLDPFLGAGTTLLVASRLGRNGIGVELKEEYAEMSRNRIQSDAPLFVTVEIDRGPGTEGTRDLRDVSLTEG